MNPESNIFKSIRQEAGRNALKLARSLEKSTYKLEAHHRHLNFTHRALENRWFPKSLRFKAPGNQQIFNVGGTVSNCLLSVNVIVNRFYIAPFTLYHILYH